VGCPGHATNTSPGSAAIGQAIGRTTRHTNEGRSSILRANFWCGSDRTSPTHGQRYTTRE
ncbi:MAG: hypothetical protein ACK5QX_03125, partial [bacterium]